MAEYDDGAAFISNLSVYSKLFIELVKSGPLLMKCISFMDITECLEIANLQKSMTDTAATQLLLNRMLNKHLQEPGVWKQFLVALEEAGYSYIAKVLSGETQYDEDTQKLQKKIINIFASEIESRLTPSDLLSIVVNLKSREVIQPCDEQEIKSLLDRIGIWAATSQLLYVLPCKKDSWYSEFLLTLLHLDTENTKTFSNLVNSIDPDWYIKQVSLSSDNVSVTSVDAAPSKKQTEFDTDIEQTNVLQVFGRVKEHCLTAGNLDFDETDSDSDESLYEDAMSASSVESTKHVVHRHPKRTTPKSLVNDLNLQNATSVKKQISPLLSSNIPDTQSEISESDNTIAVGVGVRPKNQNKIVNSQNDTIDNNNTDPKTFDVSDTDTQSEKWEIDNTKAVGVGARPKNQNKIVNSQNDTIDNNNTDPKTFDVSDTGRKEEIDSHDDAEPTNEGEKLIKPRKYQEELAELGIKGKNVIICAPTGSGKTYPAFSIVQNHLAGKSRKIRKVIFLVNQVLLADQQHKECQRFLPAYKSEVLTGDTQATAKEPFLETVKRNDILVVTAQILVDALLCKDIENVAIFSLIIFDECHHTHDRHQFNQIMNHYMDLKFSREFTTDLPQIVGLTASPGVGKAKRREEAVEHIFKLMSNLDAEDISTVSANLEELESYVNTPEQDIQAVPQRKQNPFKDEICRIMRNIEEHMAIYKGLDKIMENNPDFQNFLSAPSSKGSEVYVQWVSVFGDQCALIIDSDIKRYYSTCCQHLKVSLELISSSIKFINHLMHQFTQESLYVVNSFAFSLLFFSPYISYLFSSWVATGRRPILAMLLPEGANAVAVKMYNLALMINEDCRSSDAVDYLLSEVTDLYRDTGETNKWLTQLFEERVQALTAIDEDDPLSRNPKLEALKKKLINAYEKNPDLRGIVFVKTLILAEYIKTWMTETDGLRDLNPTKLVGAGASIVKGGMTQRKQKDVMEYFKGGTHKLIIATSVAQEGLDIQKCNFVERYAHVTNEIAMVQSRGRARAGESVYGVTDEQGKGTVEKEALNIVREKLMFESMHDLKQYIHANREEFIQKKEKMQKESKVERELRAQEQRSKVYSDSEFELLCRNCNNFCCFSTSLRVIKNAHRIIIDKQFKEHIKLKAASSKTIDDFERKSIILCSECGQTWGVVFDHLGVLMPAVAIKNLVIVDYRNKRTLCKKWSGVPFHVEEFGLDDKRKLLDTFINTD